MFASTCTSNHYDLARFKAVWIPWSAAQSLKPNYFTFPTQDSETAALSIKTLMTFTPFFFFLPHILHCRQWILHIQMMEGQKTRSDYFAYTYSKRIQKPLVWVPGHSNSHLVFNPHIFSVLYLWRIPVHSTAMLEIWIRERERENSIFFHTV